MCMLVSEFLTNRLKKQGCDKSKKSILIKIGKMGTEQDLKQHSEQLPSYWIKAEVLQKAEYVTMKHLTCE